MHGHCCRRSTNPEPLQRFGYKVPVHTLSETLSFKLYIVLDIATYLDHHQYLHGPNIFQSPFNRRSHFQMITYVPRCRRGTPWSLERCLVHCHAIASICSYRTYQRGFISSLYYIPGTRAAVLIVRRHRERPGCVN